MVPYSRYSLSLLGVSVVLTDSMEPTLRPGDLAVYAGVDYGVGDIVVYCSTPSHCYVHRVVGFLTLDTVVGNKTVVITKGDNAEAPDSPVELVWVRGKVVLVAPRELWGPAALAYAFYGLTKTPVVGRSYALLLAVSLAALAAVYAAVPRPVVLDALPTPAALDLDLWLEGATRSTNITIRAGVPVSSTTNEVQLNLGPNNLLALAGRFTAAGQSVTIHLRLQLCSAPWGAGACVHYPLAVALAGAS